MILNDKTIELKGYTVQLAKSYDKICVRCDDCKKEYDKIKRDLSSWDGRCASCIGRVRGKTMGDKFGKSQTLKGKCRNCSASIRSTLKYCQTSDCRSAARKMMSDRFKGSNNPAWTGNYACSCGSKKSAKAKMCRSCSFKSGERSGKNNGRFIEKDRSYYLQCVKSRKILSGIMSNVCRSGGVTKNKKKTREILGYSWKEFKEHMERQFVGEMSWDTYGSSGWSVDHILPVDWFIKNDVFDIRIVNSLKNLRPLDHKTNMRKSALVSMGDPWSFYEDLKYTSTGKHDCSPRDRMGITIQRFKV